MREGKKVDAILRLTFDNFLFFKSFFNKKPRDLKLIVSKRSRAQVNNSSLPEKSQKKTFRGNANAQIRRVKKNITED